MDAFRVGVDNWLLEKHQQITSRIPAKEEALRLAEGTFHVLSVGTC